MNQRIVWYRVNDSNVQTADQGVLNVPGSSGAGNVLTVINGTGDEPTPREQRSISPRRQHPRIRFLPAGRETPPEWPMLIRRTLRS